MAEKSAKKTVRSSTVKRRIDESALTKGELRKLNALRKSVGDSLGEQTFAMWLQKKATQTNDTPPDKKAKMIAEANTAGARMNQEAKFLTELLRQVQEPGAPYISPARFAKLAHIDTSRMAVLTGVHRNTVSRRPGSRKLQARLQEIIAVLSAAAGVTGDLSKAMFWFFNQPIADYHHKTAAEIVTAGHVDAVRAYIEDARSGNYG